MNRTKLIALQQLQTRAGYIIEKARIKDNWFRSWLNLVNARADTRISAVDAEGNIIRYDRSNLTHKIMNKRSPERFQARSSVSKYNARNCQDFQIPRYRTELAKNGFHYSAPKVWSDIPVELSELSTQNSFKKLKIYLKG